MNQQKKLNIPLIGHQHPYDSNSKYRKRLQFKKKYFMQDYFLLNGNCLSSIIFSWISPLLEYGSRFNLQQKAVPKLLPQHKPKVDFIHLSQALDRTERSKIQGLTLTKSICKGFKKQLLVILLLAIIKTGFQMYSPILSHDVINYISNGQRTSLQSSLYFLAIFLVTLFMALDTAFLFFYFGVLGFNLSNTLSLMVFNKSLKHPLITEKKFSVSDIINYSQVDAQRMTFMGFQLVALLFTPFQIIIGLYLLYVYIGPSFMIGTGVMIILMLFTLIFSKIASKYNDRLLTAKDSRMKLTQQILQIIKFIKINALEKLFFKKINQKRQKQLECIKTVNICYVVNVLVYWLCPPLIVSATFLWFLHNGNQITAAKAFTTIIIFNILQYPMRLFPTSISAFIQMWASIKRIQTFLLSEEIDRKAINYHSYKDEKYAVQILHGYFLWGKQKQNQQKQTKLKRRKKQQKRIQQQKLQASQNQQLHYTSLTRNKNIKLLLANQNSSTDDHQNIRDSQIQNINEQQLIDQKSQTSSVYIQKYSVIGAQKKKLVKKQTFDPNSDKKQERYIKALQEINIKIPAKKITMIIGNIGSGKTSLLYAILNQMTPQPMRNPSVDVYGSIAFSPQKPWIMAGTVKQNILFFNPYNQQRFNQVLHYSCLQNDLKLFANGIDTQIGEKGVNLSGGQKARINLARSLYSNRDIYLLDDILSAVDVHVGKFIMEKTIMGYLKDKTVIMPTHAVKFLQHADNIIIMKKGKVVTSGPLKYVKESQQFQNILQFQQKKMQEQDQNNLSKQEQSIINDQKVIKEVVKSFADAKKQQQQHPQMPVAAVEKVVEQLIMPQDQKTGSVSKQIYLQYIRQNGGFIFAFGVLFCLASWTVLSTLSNIQVKNWCQDQQKSSQYLYLYVVFGVCAGFFSGLRAYILVLSGLKQGRILHKKILKALLYTSLTKFYNRIPMGRILNRLSKDLREVDETIGVTLGSMLVNVFCLIASLTMCIYGSTPWMLIPIIITGFACIKIKDYYLKTQRQCVRLQNITNSPIVSGFTSTINGVGSIRAYNLQVQFLNSQIQKVDVNKRMRICRTAMESWFALRLTFLSFFINMSAIAFCLLSGQQTASVAGLLLTYSTLLSDDIINVAFSYASLQLKMVSVERVSAFTEIQPETGYAEYYKEWRTKQQGCDLHAIKYGNIEFKNYSAKYRQQLPLVIKNVSFKISAGDKVGIVGRTGAGKSTLINCLLRILQPTSGSIMIDGKDIMSFNLKDLRSCMTMIQQQPTLMNGTFRDNLDPTCIYSNQQILGVLQQCNLSQMVEMKGGLDGKLTNETLSVGQKQLLCISRAFLKQSKIILVDEATANIDVKNDHLIQKVIAQKFKNSTVLTIAHRLTTLKDCDKIIVMGEGKVLQWGSAIQLLGSDSIYRKMCESNDKSYLD